MVIGKIIDITGERYGKLIVIGLANVRKHGKTAWICNCDCGLKNIVATTTALKSGNTKSCGCLRKEEKIAKPTIDLVGQQFSELTVIKFDQELSTNKKENYWICKCNCGNEEFFSVSGHKLRSGKKQRCQLCTNKKISESQKQHGMKYTKIYSLWNSMKQRCDYPKTNGYDNYGGRGIKVCEDWKNSFVEFYEWSLNHGYIEGLSIDRIDNYGNYEPNNCRWVTNKEQMRNMRNTIYVIYKGTEYVLLDLLEEIGRVEEYDKIRSRIKRGWSIEESLVIPFNLERHYYHFGQELIKGFKNKYKGYKITKSDFMKKYIDDKYNNRFATYANNKYIYKI